MANENRNVSEKLDAHLSGGRWLVVVASTMWMAFVLGGIYIELHEQNELRKQELAIHERQVEIMQRQYALDSLRFEKSR